MQVNLDANFLFYCLIEFFAIIKLSQIAPPVNISRLQKPLAHQWHRLLPYFVDAEQNRIPLAQVQELPQALQSGTKPSSSRCTHDQMCVSLF